MAKVTFELWGRYNKETNTKMNEAIKLLTQEEWDKQFPAYFKSVHELCSHIFGGDHRWLRRFKTIREFKSLGSARFDIEYDFGKLFFNSIDDYLAERKELDAIIMDFMKELSDDDFGKKLKWVTYKGIECSHTFKTSLLHLFNHQTHHRGMISQCLEFLGKENDFSNLYPYGE